MFRIPAVTLMIWMSLIAVQGVSYVRYYRTEQDFMRGIPMEATRRKGVDHIEALYSKYDRILSKARIDTGGHLIREEIYEYDFSGTLLRRSIRDGSGRTEKMYVYGDREEMSKTFLSYAFPNRDLREFSDRVTVYRYLPDGKVDRYEFLSVDGTPMGSISHKYFDSGLVKEERWITEPEGRTIRLFQYDYDPDLHTYELTEYDSKGQEISHVGLVPPGRDEVPQAQLNVLPESREIIEDILRRKDLIYLKNGDTLRVNLVQISDEFVRFKMAGERDTLTIPLSAVGEIERLDGKILYPVVY